MWIFCVFRLAHSPHPLTHNPLCEDQASSEAEISCLLQTDPALRVVIPVVSRSAPGGEIAVDARDLQDGCECSSLEECISNGIRVNPRCGCHDFTASGGTFCYVRGDCVQAQSSRTFPGAKYKDCDAPPPPPPAPGACDDPRFAEQWHLSKLNVLDAWKHTHGNGSMLVVIDDGVQYRHPDLEVAGGYGYDFKTGTRLQTADDEHSRHGTASAGIAVAQKDNRVGGCGIAPHSSFLAVKLLQNYMEGDITFYFSDDLLIDTLDTFGSMEEGVVLSNSWGPTDDRRVEGPGILASYTRIDTALTNFGSRGRAGKGGVVVFAAGNGGEYDNSNDDGFTSHPYTFAIGAVGDDNRKTAYSEPGACIDVVTPSDGGWRSIVTTDLVGQSGYSAGNTTGFGGTSASSPMGSAALALLLAVRPDLTLRDLKKILHSTAYINDPDDSFWVANGVGILYNPWYGFGTLDVGKAVTTALEWVPLPPASEVCSPDWVGNLPLTHRLQRLFEDLSSDIETVDEARVYVDIEHERRGDLRLVVISPNSTRSVLTFLVPTTQPMHTVAFVAHSYLTHAFSGEYGSRTGWSLEINDTSRTPGRLMRMRICVRGYVPPNPPSLPPGHSLPSRVSYPSSDSPPPPSSPSSRLPDSSSPPPGLPPGEEEERGDSWVRPVVWSAVGLAIVAALILMRCSVS